GADEEPLGVLLDPRVIRGALQREVEGHLDAELAARLHQTPEVLEGAELRVHGVVSPRLAADGPGRPHVARLTHPRVVASLAVRKADWMDRRQVDDVEAERGDLGDPALRVAEGAVTTRLRALRAGEELVPGRETRLRAVHDDGKEDRARGVPRVDGAVHQLEQGLRKG